MTAIGKDAGFTNANLAYAMQHVARHANAEIASHVQGLWNPRYCNADASDRAVRVFSEIEAEIAHWKAIANAARKASPKDCSQ
jgi:hypothetical protein